jgi:quinol monooxygenase YgiN
VYQSESDPLRFLLMEHWQSKADWEAHRERRAFRAIYQPRVLPRVLREPHVSVRVE